MFDVKTGEWWVVIATLLGPILAVQTQKFIERVREHRQRRVNLFYTLMGTRANRTDPAHVSALNMIELVFGQPSWLDQILSPRATARNSAVVNAWRSYHAKLKHVSKDMTQSQRDVWVSEPD